VTPPQQTGMPEVSMSRSLSFPPDPRDLKVCLFDFGGTLDADGVTWQDNFYSIYWENGVRAEREVFRRAFYRSDDSLTESNALLGRGLQETVAAQVKGVFASLGMTDRARQAAAISDDFIAGTKKHIERNRPLLAALARRFRMGIVSNFYGNLERVCEDLGIRDLFECIVDSNLEGVTKPEPRIFQAALNRLGVESSQAVFVGDNPYRDMLGAKGVGMPHIWLTGQAREGAEPCCPGDLVIHSFLELQGILITGSPAEQAGSNGGSTRRKPCS